VAAQLMAPQEGQKNIPILRKQGITEPDIDFGPFILEPVNKPYK
jgi:hypothetical protein